MPQVEKLSDVEKLLRLAKKLGALKYGRYRLSSGNTGKYYFNGRMLTLHPEGGRLVGLSFARKLIDVGIEIVGGPAHGAISVVTTIVSSSEHGKGPRIRGFYVLKEAKEHGIESDVEGCELKEGMRLAIVDDVCTTGKSLLRAISVVKKRGCMVKFVGVIHDRNEGGRERLKEAGYELVSLLRATPEGEVVVAR